VCRHAVDFANVCESESESESESERVRERESARVCESEGMGGKRQTKARREGGREKVRKKGRREGNTREGERERERERDKLACRARVRTCAHTHLVSTADTNEVVDLRTDLTCRHCDGLRIHVYV